jgi:SAM-dependent methyltransferase
MPTSGEGATVFEYGCGTGGAACFLAARGYDVTAMDLVPDAIAVAEERARERELEIRFLVGDICDRAAPSGPFDWIIDAFCLQSIVTDADRGAVLDTVAERLATDGRYVLTTAMFRADRDYGEDTFDEQTGIVWTSADGPGPERMLIQGTWRQPVRRHLRPETLRAELERHGLEVLEQSGPDGGEVVGQLRCGPRHDCTAFVRGATAPPALTPAEC